MPHQCPAAPGDPAPHRHHPGDGRRRAVARRRAAAASAQRLSRTGDGRPQRPVRSPRPAPGVCPHRPGVARPARACAPPPWRARCYPCNAGAGCSVLADALGVEVDTVHRALADAETCARVPVRAVPAAVRQRRHRGRRPRAAGAPPPVAAPAPARQPAGAGPRRARRHRRVRPAWAARPRVRRSCPRIPASTCSATRPAGSLYVGKSVSIRSRARAHFAPSSPPEAWTAHAAVVDYRTTASELGALCSRPADQRAQAARQQAVWPAATTGWSTSAVDSTSRFRSSRSPRTRRPATASPSGRCGRRLALELVEQLDSLFGLRHCGRRLPRREHPVRLRPDGALPVAVPRGPGSDLYRRRLDDALALFVDTGAERPLLAHVYAEMRAAAAQQRLSGPSRCGAGARRLTRPSSIGSGGVLEATHARPRLAVARHPAGGLGGVLAGRRPLVDHGPARRAPGRARCAGPAPPWPERTGGGARGACPAGRGRRGRGSSDPGWRRIPTRRSWRCVRARPDALDDVLSRALGRSGREGQLDDGGDELVLADDHV